MRIKAPALVGGLLVAFAVPAAAHAATKTVDMGLPLKQQSTFQHLGTDVNDFFPHGTTIHVGDSIKFVPTGFHTVELPRKGALPLGLILPTGQIISGVTDFAGAPFWFNGQSNVSFNPLLASGSLGKRVTYNGSKRVESGLPLANRPPPMTVKFTKTGTYTFYCNVHIGMKGTVKVVSKKSGVPSAKANAAALRTQIANDLRIAKRLGKTVVTGNSVSVGASGPGGVEYYGFFPAHKTVKVGTTVSFKMSAKSFEDHTATTGPGNPETQPTSYLGVIAASFQGANFDPRGVYPSEDPTVPIAKLTPTLHGNGFWNSGVMDRSAATAQLPPSNSVTFSAPGTYNFYCMIHPFMHGVVTVTP